MVWMRPSRVPKKERKKERKRHGAGGVGCRVSGDVFDAGVLVEVVVADREAGKGNGKKVKSKQEGRKGARVEGGVGAAGIYLGRSSRTEKKRYLCRRVAVALESSTTSQQGTRTGGQMRRSCSRRPTPMWTRDRARAGCLSVRRSGKWKGGKWGSGSKWGRVQQPAAAPGMGWLQHRAHTFCFPRDQPFSAKAWAPGNL